MGNASENVIELSSRRAERFITKGMSHVSRGEIAEALECFKSSIETRESAEAYTYWGWMVSFMGNLDRAIELCQKAIATDPEFGNPYNDIGTYMMRKGDMPGAIPWLERAKMARRYEPKHFPYLNLGRVYLSQGQYARALTEFEAALGIDPRNSELRSIVSRLRQTLRSGSGSAS